MEYSDSFNESMKHTITMEGGFTDDPNDRGNWTSGVVGKGTLKGTNYGISAMSYPDLDIKNLTIDEVYEIYHRDYWTKYHLDDIHPMVAMQLFDAIVNHGDVNSIKMIQKVVGENADGIIGPKTISSINYYDPLMISISFLSERLKFYTKIKTFNIYGKGWVNRIVQNMKLLTQ